MKKARFIFQIITTSGVPIYRQIIDQVNTQIVMDGLESGTYLPSVREVAKQLEVNPMTVSKAYSTLEKEGVLESVRGMGMKVATSKKPENSFKNRKEELNPLLYEVVRKARQLSLSTKYVVKKIESIWKENNNE